MAELAAGAADARARRGRLFLIVGEPGIGKTRLAEHGADLAAAGGARAVWGRCVDGGGAPPYWPWIQIVRMLAREAASARWLSDLGAGAARLRQIFPELQTATTTRIDSGAAATDTEQARFALFDATVGFLARAAAEQPLVLVLDDLHGADDPSLRLLEFLGRELHHTNIVVIGTARAAESERRPETAQLLNAIVRYGARLPLGGLSDADVVAFIRARFGLSAPPPLAASVCRMTEGNPFFIDEVVRMLIADHDGLPEAMPAAGLRIPPGVRATTRERLRPLPSEYHRVLDAAAVVGREFDATGVQEIVGDTSDALLEALRAAQGAGLVAETRGIPGRYAFTHDLIREVLYDDLAPAERMRLHAQAAAMLERLAGDDIDLHLDELAHHHLAAAPAGHADTAARYALRAGQQAAARLAYEDAEAYFTRGLHAAGMSAPPDEAARLELLLALGEVQVRRGAGGEARKTFLHAAALARTRHATEPLARAALGMADSRGLGVPSGPSDPAIVALIDEALAELPAGDSAMRAQLLARLGSERCLAEEWQQSIALTDDAVAMSRRLRDPATLAVTLSVRHFVLWRSNVHDRLGVVTELLQLADGLGDQDLAAQGRTWRLIDLVALGDVHAFDRELATYVQFVAGLRRPRYDWLVANFRTMRALWAGRWDIAEAAALECLSLAERVADPIAMVNPWVQIFLIRREQGRLIEEEGKAQFFADRFPSSPVIPTFLALIYCDLGRLDEARAILERVAAEGFADIIRERRTGLLPHLVEVCVQLRDRQRAGLLFDLLLPHAGGNLAYGASVCFGATTRYLGSLAALLGRWPQAIEFFDDAVGRHTRMEAEPLLARTLYDYAAALSERGQEDDVSHARELLGRAAAIARSLAMTALNERIVVLDTRLAEGDGKVDRLEEPAAAAGADRLKGQTAAPSRANQHVFKHDGEFWTIGDVAAPVRLKDSVGLHYLARLLRHPGGETHALDLVSGDPAEVRAHGLATQGGSDPGDVGLDARARSAYRRRLEDLRDQLEEASRFNDVGRSDRLRQEIDLLSSELARGVGLGGRPRRHMRHVERARVSATRVIRAAIGRIAEQDPELGLYLRTTIKTGTFCSYTPDPRFPITWSW